MNIKRRSRRIWVCWMLSGACAQFGGCGWNGAINTLGGQLGGGAAATGINGGVFGGNLPATPNYGIPLVQAGGGR